MTKKTISKLAQPKPLALLIAGLLSTQTALASGYHFGTQSVSAQSTANSAAAEAADASTIFYNSAGLTKLDGTNFSINANFVAPNIEYKNAKGYYPDQTPIAGSDSGKITKDLVVAPHIYASHQLTNDFTIGLGVYVPFGSETEYQHDSVMRYNINKMGLTSIAINPTFGYKINDNHSVGLGVIGQFSSAELRQYANLGKLAKLPNGVDSYAKIEGEDWGFGYNLSYLWDTSETIRLGANYRSKIEHTLSGTAEWITANPAYANPQLLGAIRGAGYVANEKASVKIVTPESLSLHGMVKLNDKWNAFGDVTWTRHSRFNRLAINYETPKVVANVSNPAAGPVAQSTKTTIQPKWRDTFKVGLGASYQYSDPLQLRFGVAFDQAPVKDPDYRLSTLPDDSRIWFSLGAKYDFNNHSSLNVGYSYIHIRNASANVNGWCGSLNPTAVNCVSSRTNASADFENSAQILGIQYNYKF